MRFVWRVCIAFTGFPKEATVPPPDSGAITEGQIEAQHRVVRIKVTKQSKFLDLKAWVPAKGEAEWVGEGQSSPLF